MTHISSSIKCNKDIEISKIEKIYSENYGGKFFILFNTGEQYSERKLSNIWMYSDKYERNEDFKGIENLLIIC